MNIKKWLKDRRNTRRKSKIAHLIGQDLELFGFERSKHGSIDEWFKGSHRIQFLWATNESQFVLQQKLNEHENWTIIHIIDIEENFFYLLLGLKKELFESLCKVEPEMPVFPLTVRWNDEDEITIVEDLFDAASGLEWFDSEYDGEVFDANGRQVALFIKATDVRVFRLR